MADLLSSIKGLLESEKYADLILRCKGETFRVHCAVVCTRSPILTQATEQRQFKEASLREIDLSADELPIIRAMIRYLYTDDYPDDAAEQDDCASLASICTPEDEDEDVATPLPIVADPAFPLLFNVKMYIAGNKFSIPGLKHLATKKYQDCVAQHWNTDVFSKAAAYLWDGTTDKDRELRNVVIQAAFQNIAPLLDREEFVKLMKSRGDFCFEIVQMMNRQSLDAAHREPLKVAKKEVEPGPEPEPEQYPEEPKEDEPCDDYGWGSYVSKKEKKKKGKNARTIEAEDPVEDYC